MQSCIKLVGIWREKSAAFRLCRRQILAYQVPSGTCQAVG